MKTLILIITILFSFSVMGDCCNSEVETDCKTETLKHSQCQDSNHSESEPDHDVCHCSFGCVSKVIKNPDLFIINITFSSSIIFQKYIENFQSFSPLPYLRPPIA